MGTIRFYLLVLLGIACSFINTHAIIPSTEKIRLNDGWEFIRQDMANAWEAVRPVRVGQPEMVPFWTKVTLPHCFNAEDAVDPNVNYYQGPGWYRTSISVDNPYQAGRVLLEFEGAGQKTDVYVYTKHVGTHVGGYDSWNVDITEAVEAFKKTDVCLERYDGRIPIVIRCDNSRDTEMIPSDMSDFNLYGGLYRYVNLVYTPSISFGQILISSSTDSKGQVGSVRIKTYLYAPQDFPRDKTTLNVVIKAPDGKEIYSNQKSDDLKLTIESDEITIRKPMLWDVDSPMLYTCEMTLNVNGETVRAIERFGFRHTEFREKGPFYLNGKRLLLRGTHRHEDHAGVAAALTEEMMVEEMMQIKRMGANFIRLGHYQQSDIILRLCDELGILVWEEIPWCRGGLGGERYKTQARQMLTNMILQHHNHPSIILWGMGNENDWPGDFETFDKEMIRSFMKELHDLSHKLDPSRMTAIRRCEFCKDIIDVYSPSIWAGWYSRSFPDYYLMAKEGMDGTSRFLHAEWGGDSHAGRHMESDYQGAGNAAKNGDWSESYIVRLFDWHLKEQENMSWLTGAAFWTFKDFSTPLRPENPIPYVNQKGVVERDGTPKESYYVFQSYWSKEPMIHIYGHSRPVRWGEANEKKEVLVYSNCTEVELFLNGVSQGVRKRNSQDYPAAGLRWNVIYNKGTANALKAVGVNNGKVYSDEIVQSYVTEKWGKPAKLNLTATVLCKDTVLIKAELKDLNGTPCLDSQDYIEFSGIGNGILLQNLGTAGGSKRVQASNGRASIKVSKGANLNSPFYILAKSGTLYSNQLSLFDSDGGISSVSVK